MTMTSLKTFWSASPKETINVAPSFKLEGTALKLVSLFFIAFQNISWPCKVNSGGICQKGGT